MGEQTNGWRSGHDPVQRWLRVVASILCLAVFVYLAVVRQSVDVVPTLALAMGALLLLLGYESAIRIPGLSRDALPTCMEPGCDNYATRAGYCDRHRRAIK